MPGRTSEPIQIYQLKVTLRGSRPPIWRQFKVSGDITLGKLHRILQVVMGWTDTHLHQFTIRGKQYGIPDEGDMDLRKTIDERKHRLRDVVPDQNLRFTYEYDFGDLWAHGLLVENIIASQADVRYPVCLAGARACPPEDVGGIAGYANFLDAINNPRHPEHQEYLDWIGDSFDPVAFDVNKINRTLQRIKQDPSPP